jgi:hypothetical protein
LDPGWRRTVLDVVFESLRALRNRRRHRRRRRKIKIKRINKRVIRTTREKELEK